MKSSLCRRLWASSTSLTTQNFSKTQIVNPWLEFSRNSLSLMNSYHLHLPSLSTAIPFVTSTSLCLWMEVLTPLVLHSLEEGFLFLRLINYAKGLFRLEWEMEFHIPVFHETSIALSLLCFVDEDDDEWWSRLTLRLDISQLAEINESGTQVTYCMHSLSCLTIMFLFGWRSSRVIFHSLLVKMTFVYLNPLVD